MRLFRKDFSRFPSNTRHYKKELQCLFHSREKLVIRDCKTSCFPTPNTPPPPQKKKQKKKKLKREKEKTHQISSLHLQYQINVPHPTLTTVSQNPLTKVKNSFNAQGIREGMCLHTVHLFLKKLQQVHCMTCSLVTNVFLFNPPPPPSMKLRLR